MRLSEIFVFFFVDFLMFLTKTSRTVSTFFDDFMYFFIVFGHNLECFGQFFERFSSLGAAFVHRRVGFKRFCLNKKSPG